MSDSEQTAATTLDGPIREFYTQMAPHRHSREATRAHALWQQTGMEVYDRNCWFHLLLLEKINSDRFTSIRPLEYDPATFQTNSFSPLG